MKSNVKPLMMIALYPAMMGATAGITIPFGTLPAITLQTLFVYLAGLTLSPRDAGISMFIYLLLGAIGIPVFSGYRGGIAILATGSGGFIIGFIVMAMFISFMKNVKIINKEYWNNWIILLLGTTLLYMFGASYISYLTNTSLWLVLGGFVIYLAGDFIKILVAIHVHVRIRSHVTYEHP